MFFNRLWKALSLGVRMMKNIILRPFRALYFQVQRSASLSRQAAKAAPKLAKSITKVKLKPESRADYIETRGAFIAKPLFILMVLLIVAVGVLGYFIVWPWMESRFFVAHMPTMAEKAANHSGRVALYYDNDKTKLEYEGRLEEGVRCGVSKEYYENGVLKYQGDMENGVYFGNGELYDQEGLPVYEGGFADGVYDGKGTLYQDGVRVYQGGFVQGLYEGQGALYENGDTLTYEGGFLQGQRSGNAKVYQGGVLVYEGAYSQDAYNGSGKLYYPSGALKAEGTFSNGRMSGQGIEYYEGGSMRYQGMFDLGEYAGEGVLYQENGDMLYRGGFSLGLYEGEGTLYHQNGKPMYKGGFSLGLYEGQGVLYREDGSKHIVGAFEGGGPVGDVEIYAQDGRLQYKGGYQNGTYQGEGVLYYNQTRWIEGLFEKGEPTGIVKLYVDKVLYYEGGYRDGALNGEGRIFNPLGEVVFSGVFKGGVPDATNLLGQEIQVIYDLFGQGNYEEIYTETGVLVVSTDVNMAAFLNYPIPVVDGQLPAAAEVEEEPSTVHRFYVYEYGLLGGYVLATMPLPDQGVALNTSQGNAPEYDGVDAMSGQRLLQGRYSTTDYYYTAWSSGEYGHVQLIEFKSTVPLPVPDVLPEIAGAVLEDGGDTGY